MEAMKQTGKSQDPAKDYGEHHADSHTLCCIQTLLNACRGSILDKKPLPIFTNFKQTFNPSSLSYELNCSECSQISIGPSTVSTVARILEMAAKCAHNLEEGKKMTKRSLFYHMSEYYTDYKLIDSDLRLLCCNLSLIGQSLVTRDRISIVASGRGIIYGRIHLEADGETISSLSTPDMVALPPCRQIEVIDMLEDAVVLLVEKESIFYEIMGFLKRHSPKYDNLVVVSAKGYPDLVSRRLLLSLESESLRRGCKIYYCGDYDVFGLDIFLFYAFGDWSCGGILPSIELLRLDSAEHIFDYTQMVMNEFDSRDHKKMQEILKKEFFTSIGASPHYLAPKVRALYEYMLEFAAGQMKCELEQFVRAARSPSWFKLLVDSAQPV